MEIVVTLYYLGNNDKKKSLFMPITDTISPQIFSIHVWLTPQIQTQGYGRLL
jgi:hypothetical protein